MSFYCNLDIYQKHVNALPQYSLSPDTYVKSDILVTARDPGVTRHWNESWYPVPDERFRGIFDPAFHFMGLMAPDGTLLEANRTELEPGELRAENVIGNPFSECDWWTLTERTGWELRTAIGRAASGELVRYDVELRGAEAGRVVLLLAEGRDITDLKRSEETLRLTNDRFDLAVRASKAVLWQQDQDLRFTWLYNLVPGFDGMDPVGKREAELLEHAEAASQIPPGRILFRLRARAPLPPQKAIAAVPHSTARSSFQRAAGPGHPVLPVAV